MVTKKLSCDTLQIVDTFLMKLVEHVAVNDGQRIAKFWVLSF